MVNLGIKGAISTPHIIGDLYRNDEISIKNAFDLLNNELKKQDIDFQLKAAAEYMLDMHFVELLNKKEKLLALKDNIILTEFSYLSSREHV